VSHDHAAASTVVGVFSQLAQDVVGADARGLHSKLSSDGGVRVLRAWSAPNQECAGTGSPHSGQMPEQLRVRS